MLLHGWYAWHWMVFRKISEPHLLEQSPINGIPESPQLTMLLLFGVWFILWYPSSQFIKLYQINGFHLEITKWFLDKSSTSLQSIWLEMQFGWLYLWQTHQLDLLLHSLILLLCLPHKYSLCKSAPEQRWTLLNSSLWEWASLFTPVGSQLPPSSTPPSSWSPVEWPETQLVSKKQSGLSSSSTSLWSSTSSSLSWKEILFTEQSTSGSFSQLGTDKVNTQISKRIRSFVSLHWSLLSLLSPVSFSTRNQKENKQEDYFIETIFTRLKEILCIIYVDFFWILF